MLPYIYIVICLNVSHVVGVLLHLFVNFIPFAHSFPHGGPTSPHGVPTRPTVGPQRSHSGATLWLLPLQSHWLLKSQVVSSTILIGSRCGPTVGPQHV